jgi:molybdenum cofactor biosynthesis protein B
MIARMKKKPEKPKRVVVGHRFASTVPDEHRARGPRAVRCAVITVSDSKSEATDRGGPEVRGALSRAGHETAWSSIVRDEPAAIRGAIERGLGDAAVQAIVLTGGTGVTSRDITVEVVSGLLEKELPGFGELFRALSFQEIGSAAFMSRATAGVSKRKALFAVPGSPSAARLAVERLIAPELPHLVEQLSR